MAGGPVARDRPSEESVADQTFLPVGSSASGALRRPLNSELLLAPGPDGLSPPPREAADHSPLLGQLEAFREATTNVRFSFGDNRTSTANCNAARGDTQRDDQLSQRTHSPSERGTPTHIRHVARVEMDSKSSGVALTSNDLGGPHFFTPVARTRAPSHRAKQLPGSAPLVSAPLVGVVGVTPVTAPGVGPVAQPMVAANAVYNAGRGGHHQAHNGRRLGGNTGAAPPPSASAVQGSGVLKYAPPGVVTDFRAGVLAQQQQILAQQQQILAQQQVRHMTATAAVLNRSGSGVLPGYDVGVDAASRMNASTSATRVPPQSSASLQIRSAGTSKESRGSSADSRRSHVGCTQAGSCGPLASCLGTLNGSASHSALRSRDDIKMHQRPQTHEGLQSERNGPPHGPTPAVPAAVWPSLHAIHHAGRAGAAQQLRHYSPSARLPENRVYVHSPRALVVEQPRYQVAERVVAVSPRTAFGLPKHVTVIEAHH